MWSEEISNLFGGVVFAVSWRVMCRAISELVRTEYGFIQEFDQNLHFHQEVMAILEISLGHTNSDWEFSRSIKSMTLDPHMRSNISLLVNIVGCWERNRSNREGESTQERELCEVHDESDDKTKGAWSRSKLREKLGGLYKMRNRWLCMHNWRENYVIWVLVGTGRFALSLIRRTE